MPENKWKKFNISWILYEKTKSKTLLAEVGNFINLSISFKCVNTGRNSHVKDLLRKMSKVRTLSVSTPLTIRESESIKIHAYTHLIEKLIVLNQLKPSNLHIWLENHFSFQNITDISTEYRIQCFIYSLCPFQNPSQ